MNSGSIVKEMGQYLHELQNETNKEAAIIRAKYNLIGMGYINENLEVLSPYNGEKVNDEDFTVGPGEFQYIKSNK